MLLLRLIRSEVFRLMLAGFLVATAGLVISQPSSARTEALAAQHSSHR